MAEYRVTMQRSPNVTDEECRRRLAAAYRVIRECARRAQTEATDQEALANDTRTAAGPTTHPDADTTLPQKRQGRKLWRNEPFPHRRRPSANKPNLAWQP